jgi:hypothetical protein
MNYFRKYTDSVTLAVENFAFVVWQQQGPQRNARGPEWPLS